MSSNDTKFSNIDEKKDGKFSCITWFLILSWNLNSK